MQGIKTEIETVVSKMSEQARVQLDTERKLDRMAWEQQRGMKTLFDDQNRKLTGIITKHLNVKGEQGELYDEE